MLKIILCMMVVLIPAIAFSDIIELKCTGEKHVYNSDLKPSIIDNSVQTLVINTMSKKMDIIIGVSSKTVKYIDDKNILRTKFTPDVYMLDDKILYETLLLNRYTGEMISSYKFEGRDTANYSFVGKCEPTKRRF